MTKKAQEWEGSGRKLLKTETEGQRKTKRERESAERERENRMDMLRHRA